MLKQVVKTTHPAIALAGRVPVKVVGPVHKGDLLVSADVEGRAKADNDAKAGRILGKAMESVLMQANMLLKH